MNLAEPSAFRVEKYRADAVVTLTNGAAVIGHFFLAKASPTLDGSRARRRAAQLGIRLLPVRGPRTVRRCSITGITSSASRSQTTRRSRDPGYGVATARTVSVLLSNGQHIQGTVRVYRPEGRDRLSDWARHGPRFRYIETAHATFIINVDHIVYATRGSIVTSSAAAIDQLFHAMCAKGASDLHLCVGSPPIVRKDGRMEALDPSAPALTVADIDALLEPIMPERNRKEFAERHDTDFAYEIPDLARFRANAFVDRKGPGAVFRVIPTQDPDGGAAGALSARAAVVSSEQGAHPGHRADWFWKVDDAVRADRLHQPESPRPHHYDRGSDRVRASEPEVPHQSARGAHAHRLVQGRACAPRSEKIRTSCSSASCAIWRRSPSRSRPPKPVTWYSARCTPRPRRRRSIG